MVPNAGYHDDDIEDGFLSNRDNYIPNDVKNYDPSTDVKQKAQQPIFSLFNK